MPQAHYFQHIPFEGLGRIEPWLLAHGYQIRATRFYAGEPPPDLDSVELLIILGGPMSINDEAAYPWLASEKQFIKNALEGGKPVLGVCLGAQLMAAALGARVYRAPEPEIGWLPIESCPSPHVGTFLFPDKIEAFHWHGETFDLPAGARLLARSAACPHQAFQWGQRAIGLQFHLETTPELATALCQHCAHELVAAPYVQSAEAIRNAPDSRYEKANACLGSLLDWLTRT